MIHAFVQLCNKSGTCIYVFRCCPTHTNLYQCSQWQSMPCWCMCCKNWKHSLVWHTIMTAYNDIHFQKGKINNLYVHSVCPSAKAVMTRFMSKWTNHNKLRHLPWSTKSGQGVKALTTKQHFKLQWYTFLDPYCKPKSLVGADGEGNKCKHTISSKCVWFKIFPMTTFAGLKCTSCSKNESISWPGHLEFLVL